MNDVYKMCIYCSQYCSRYIFSLDLERDTQAVRGTMHKKCVYVVPITAVDAYFPLTLKEILRL